MKINFYFNLENYVFSKSTRIKSSNYIKRKAQQENINNKNKVKKNVLQRVIKCSNKIKFSNYKAMFSLLIFLTPPLLSILKNKNSSLLFEIKRYIFQFISFKMAQLFRFLNTEDRYKSEIFTFMLPSNFILDTSDCELKSRDFSSNNQKWSLSFSKTSNQLNAFLTLKSACDHMTVTAEYGITLVNREHFARNEGFFEKNCSFTNENAVQGRKAFVSLDTICTLDYMDERGNIQCELEIRNVSSVYSYQQHIPVTPVYNRNPSELKILSSFFMFGNYQWNICIQPKIDSVGSIVGLKFYIVRSSSLDHVCKISYRYKFINGAFVHDSGVIDQYSDLNGASNSYRMEKAKELLQLTGKFVIRLELIKINSIFSNVLYPFIVNKEVQPVNFHDRDGQKWSLESHIEDNCFILRLFYIDIHNIPNGYVRLMSFNIAIRHNQLGSVYVFKKPVIKYYYKQEIDDGLEITTTVDVNDVSFFFYFLLSHSKHRLSNIDSLHIYKRI